MKRILLKIQFLENKQHIFINNDKFDVCELNCINFYNIISQKYNLYNNKNQKQQYKKFDFKIVINSKIVPLSDEPLTKYISEYLLNNQDLNTLREFEYFSDNSQLFFIDIIGLVKGGNPISKIVNALNAILRVFKLLLKGVIFLFKITIWIIQFSLWFMVEFLNPVYLFNDIIGSLLKITRLCIIGIFDIIFGFVKVGTNTIFGPMFEGNIMGWDQETYKKQKQEKLEKEALRLRRENEVKSTFTNTDRNPDKKKGGSKKDNFSDKSNMSENKDKDKQCGDDDKCYKTPPGQLPFSIIIMTIICPPLGIFMQYGLSFWINIILCCLLTMIYYIPGLIYALILLYC